MIKEITPEQTNRAEACALWMQAPMPMVTLLKTLDVTHLVRYAKRKKVKFNMLMCYCIGKAAGSISEFMVLPVDGKLIQYDKLAISTIILNKKGNINSCDIPFDKNIKIFNDNYLQLTEKVKTKCINYDLSEYMVIGTSALVHCELDGVVNMYSGIFNNPFLVWSKYKRSWFKKKMKLSFQFHHVQMDGAEACHFLNRLQYLIDELGKKC